MKGIVIEDGSLLKTMIKPERMHESIKLKKALVMINSKRLTS
jgi:hypothetical protein